MDEYNVTIDEDTLQVSDISNRSYGPIMFEGSEMSFEQLTASTQAMDIYTQEYNASVLNVVHCHLNDMADEVWIATVYMNQEAVDSHKEFTADASGGMLHYKILIRNQAIETVLYNTGSEVTEVPFNEHKL